MPSERKSKEDTWTPSELKKAMGKDAIRREREERKKERLREEQNGEERHRRRRDEDGERKHHKDRDRDRHHRNEDEDRRRRKDRDSPDRVVMTEDERERQRRERRERKEGKYKGDEERDKDRKRRDEERDKERRHKDDERDRERRHKDEERDKERRHKDERRKHRDDDENDDRRRHRDDGDTRRHRDDDDRRKHRDDDDKRKHRNDDDRRKRRDDDDRRKHREDDERERRKHHRDEDERDRRKERKDHDRHKDTEEDERERQRRERREKREGKDSRDKDREKDSRRKEERGKSAKTRDVRSAVNGRTKIAVEKEDEEEENNEYNDYEDDFEDYEEDFEEDEEEAPKGKDDEMNQVLQALDEENDRLFQESKRQDQQSRYDRDDSPEDRGRGYRDLSPEENVMRSRPKSSVINFLSAKRQVMSQQAYGKTSKRARDLLEMIELDTVNFEILDLPPVKEYELYIRSYGRSDTRQAYVQTNDDAIERDIQTEEIDVRNKWTQHPAEDSIGSGRGDGEKDFEEEEKSYLHKQPDLGRFSKFIQQAGQVMLILLEENRSQDTTELSANKSTISMSEGYTELSILSVLKGRHVEFAYFAPTQPNMLLTIYSKSEEEDPSNPLNRMGIICVWNTNELSYPQRILACESQPRCCCFSPYRTSVAFAGMVDGSICAWDLRESSSLHKSVEYEKMEHFIRFPTYNTAGITESENHISPVTSINPVTTYVDENREESDSSESGSGISFQLVSSEDQGVINFWVVAELSNIDMGGSEIDLGLSPGGKIKVVKSSTIKLETLVREVRTLGPIRSFELQISPTDPNHYYVGTDGGYVLHGLRFGTRTYPRTFTTLSDTPVDVRSIDFSPFGHPCFLVATSEGCVHLFGTKTEKPLLSWPSKVWGTRNLKCVRWSRSRPCVFYVLDDHSQLYTFDILEGDAMPAKMETLSTEVVTCLALTSHIKVTGRHPQMLVSLADGTVQIHTISKDYREQQTLENDFLPSYLERF